MYEESKNILPRCLISDLLWLIAGFAVAKLIALSVKVDWANGLGICATLSQSRAHALNQ